MREYLCVQLMSICMPVCIKISRSPLFVRVSVPCEEWVSNIFLLWSWVPSKVKGNQIHVDKKLLWVHARSLFSCLKVSVSPYSPTAKYRLNSHQTELKVSSSWFSFHTLTPSLFSLVSLFHMRLRHYSPTHPVHAASESLLKPFEMCEMPGPHICQTVEIWFP